MENTYFKEEVLREKRRVYSRRYRRRHPNYSSECSKKWREKHPEYIGEWNKRYKEEHPDYAGNWLKTEKGRACIQRANVKRRARESEIINTLTSEEWLDILKQSDYKCAYCGISFDENNPPTRDHIIPISRGGDNVKENVVPACRSCNARKNKIVIGEQIECKKEGYE